MMKGAHKDVLSAIGNTPIVKLNKVCGDLPHDIYVKLDYLNPGGSTKDRIGWYILEQAEKKGLIKPGATIIEGTSGNTGVGLAMYAAVHGYKCIFVMADKQSQEKINNLKAFGAKVIVCPTNVDPKDPRSYYSVSARLAETVPNSYFVNQYENLLNRETHINTTGPEILKQTGGDFDVFMAGVGTGGTISGCGMFFKSKLPKVKIVGVDCEGSILTDYFKTGKMIEPKPYVLEGIGEDFIPGNYNFDVIDDFVMVGDKESFLMTRKLLKQEAIYCGGSSGAAVVGAIKYARTLEGPRQKILVMLPDSGNRYTSKIFNDDWMSMNGYSDSSFNVKIADVLEELGKKPGDLLSVQDNCTVGDAIKLMEEHGVSQVPVMADKLIKGIVSERKLLKPVFAGEFSLDDSISLAVENKFRTINVNEMLSKVADALLNKEIALVEKDGKIISLLSDIDILQFIAQTSDN